MLITTRERKKQEYANGPGRTYSDGASPRTLN